MTGVEGSEVVAPVVDFCVEQQGASGAAWGLCAAGCLGAGLAVGYVCRGVAVAGGLHGVTSRVTGSTNKSSMLIPSAPWLANRSCESERLSWQCLCGRSSLTMLPRFAYKHMSVLHESTTLALRVPVTSFVNAVDCLVWYG